MQTVLLNVTTFHNTSALCGSFFKRFPVVNDDLPARIITGRITVKPNVKEFSGSSVVFEDGSVLEVCVWTNTCM